MLSLNFSYFYKTCQKGMLGNFCTHIIIYFLRGSYSNLVLTYFSKHSVLKSCFLYPDICNQAKQNKTLQNSLLVNKIDIHKKIVKTRSTILETLKILRHFRKYQKSLHQYVKTALLKIHSILRSNLSNKQVNSY